MWPKCGASVEWWRVKLLYSYTQRSKRWLMASDGNVLINLSLHLCSKVTNDTMIHIFRWFYTKENILKVHFIFVHRCPLNATQKLNKTTLIICRWMFSFKNILRQPGNPNVVFLNDLWWSVNHYYQPTFYKVWLCLYTENENENHPVLYKKAYKLFMDAVWPSSHMGPPLNVLFTHPLPLLHIQCSVHKAPHTPQ